MVELVPGTSWRLPFDILLSPKTHNNIYNEVNELPTQGITIDLPDGYIGLVLQNQTSILRHGNNYFYYDPEKKTVIHIIYLNSRNIKKYRVHPEYTSAYLELINAEREYTCHRDTPLRDEKMQIVHTKMARLMAIKKHFDAQFEVQSGAYTSGPVAQLVTGGLVSPVSQLSSVDCLKKC
jgi:hypothetical protein